MVAEKAFRFVRSVALIKGIDPEKLTFLEAKDIARIDKNIIEWKEVLNNA